MRTFATVETVVVTEPPRRISRPGLAGAVLGTVTFLAYLPGIGRSLDFDSAETVGLFVRPGPPWAAFSRQAVFNNHPVFSFLEQVMRVVTGRTDAGTMRVLPILCGALAVGVLTWFAARRHGLVAGVVAGAVLAANPTFATLSRSVRGYSLLTLCAIVATILVADDERGGVPSRRGRGVAYALVAGVGMATHLYMVPVVLAHIGAVVARRGLDSRWRARFLGAFLVAAAAYAGMAAVMADAAAAHARVFQIGMPWRIAVMAGGSGWAAVLLCPLVVVGAATVVLRSRAARGAALAMLAGFAGLWVGLQSSALHQRFFVWVVPGAAYLAAVAVRRVSWAWVPAAAAVLVAVASLLPTYTDEPTGYRQVASLVRRVDATGGRTCIVGVGTVPMRAYLDDPADFTTVTDPEQLGRCDVVIVAAWWPSASSWFAADRQVIDAAERNFEYRLVLPARDPALVLSTRPLTGG